MIAMCQTALTIHLAPVHNQEQTKQIQDAIDRAATCGGVVVLAPGIYRTGTLKLRRNVTLRGTPVFTADESYGSVLQLYHPDANCLLDLTDACGANVHGLSCLGGNLGTSIHGIAATGTPAQRLGIHIDTVKCANFSGAGIYIERVFDLEILHSLFCNNRADGIYFSGRFLTVSDCICRKNEGCGIRIFDGTSVSITSSRFCENQQDGVQLTRADAVQLLNSGLDHNAGSGLLAKGERDRMIRGLTVNGCSFRANKTVHAAFDYLCSLSVCQNQFSPAAVLPQHAIALSHLWDAVCKTNILTGASKMEAIQDAGNHRGQVILCDNIG